MKKYIASCINHVSNEFVYGGHLVSISSSAIVYSVMVLSGHKLFHPVILLAYFASQIVYSYDYMKIGTGDNEERLQHLSKKIRIRHALFFVYLIGFVISASYTTWSAAVWAGIIAVGGVLYSEKFKYLTKIIPGFKNFYVSFFWGSLSFLVLFGLLNYAEVLLYFTLFVLIFLRVLINNIFFDIKDVNSDKKAGLKTFPVILGIEDTITFLHVINVISSVVVGYICYIKIVPIHTMVLVLFSFYTLVYLESVKGASKKTIKYVSYFVVDGEYLLWPIVLGLGKLLISL